MKLHNISTGIAADFEVNFVVNLICIRCLDTFTKEFNANIHLDYIEGKDPVTHVESVELRSTDMSKVYYTGSQIDVSIGIREAIILSLPIAPLCKDDCLGLCPVCGNDLNKKKCGCKIEKVGVFTSQQMNVKRLSPKQGRKKRIKKKN